MEKKIIYVVCAIILAALIVMLPQIFYSARMEPPRGYPQSVEESEKYETQPLYGVEPISEKFIEIFTVIIPAVFLGFTCWFYIKRKV